MRKGLFSWTLMAALSCAGVARADGDDAPSTWMLQANPYEPPAAEDDPTTTPIETGTATVSFAVRTANGADVPHARVLMDGQVLTDALQGWAVTIPVGPHVFEFDGPGFVSQEHPVTIHSGMTAELLTVTLAPVDGAGAVVAPVEPWNARTVIFQPKSKEQAADPGDPWLVTYIAGGTALAALAVGTALGVSASNQVAELRQTCAPSCTDAQLESVRSKMAIADVAFGIGIVSGGVAVVWALTHPRPDDHPRAHVGFDVHGMSASF